MRAYSWHEHYSLATRSDMPNELEFMEKLDALVGRVSLEVNYEM